MLALAILGLSAAASRILPRWLRYAGITLAVVITTSGVAYLLLLQSVAFLAFPAGALLLVFITGTGLVLGNPASERREDPAGRDAAASGRTAMQAAQAGRPGGDGSARRSPRTARCLWRHCRAAH